MISVKDTKILKRLDWLKPKDKIQEKWLHDYLLKKRNTSRRQLSSFQLRSNWEKEELQNIERFKDFMSEKHDDPELREICRNLKAAWSAWSARERNRENQEYVEGNYKISIEARKQLEVLSEQYEKSYSQVIESLLLESKKC